MSIILFSRGMTMLEIWRNKNMKYIKTEEAVSPVIGVILMVVITVIIAAIMAVFAFGVGAPEKAPSASIKIISWNTAVSNITIQHVGGDALRLADSKIVIEQTDIANQLVSRSEYNPVTTNASIKFAAGDRIELKTNASSVSFNNGAITFAIGTFTGVGSTPLTAGNTVTVSVIHRPTDSVLSQPKVEI